MKKFIALYMAPAAGLEEWMKLDESVRKDDEEKMMAEWNEWQAAHPELGPTSGAGKTKRVTKGQVADVKNDIMLVSLLEAESHDVLAEAFVDHPHFGIPGAWIDIMPLSDISETE